MIFILNFPFSYLYSIPTLPHYLTFKGNFVQNYKIDQGYTNGPVCVTVHQIINLIGQAKFNKLLLYIYPMKMRGLIENKNHPFIMSYEKCYVLNIFTINPMWQVVMGYYWWSRKVISMVSSN